MTTYLQGLCYMCARSAGVRHCKSTYMAEGIPHAGQMAASTPTLAPSV